MYYQTSTIIDRFIIHVYEKRISLFSNEIRTVLMGQIHRTETNFKISEESFFYGNIVYTGKISFFRFIFALFIL